MPNLNSVYTYMFCGRAGHFDEFYFLCKIMEKRCFECARNSYPDKFFDFLAHSYSRASPRTSSRAVSHFFHGPNHFLYSFDSQENIYLFLDALVTAHVFPVVVIVPRVGTGFLLEDLTPVLSRDTWIVHVFHIMVLVPPV
jgi:hypothetical protein